MIKSDASAASAQGGCASSRLDHALEFYVIWGGCASRRLIHGFSDCGWLRCVRLSVSEPADFMFFCPRAQPKIGMTSIHHVGCLRSLPWLAALAADLIVAYPQAALAADLLANFRTAYLDL